MLKVLYYPLNVEEITEINENGEETIKKEREKTNVEYSLKELEGKLNINIKGNFFGNDFNYSDSLNIQEYSGKCINIAYLRIKNNGEIVVTNVFDYVDRYKFVNSTSKSNEQRNLLRIIFEPEGDIVVFLMQRYKPIEGLNCIECDPKQLPTTGHLIANSKWFAEYYDKLATKGSLISETDLYSSLAYLEAQVDLLTRYILNTCNIGSDPYLNALVEADKYSVLNMKPTNDIIKEFTEKKSNFRVLQERYYGQLKK